MPTLARTNLEAVHIRIDQAARRAGRRAEDVTLVAVTKTVPLERVLPFIQAGLRDIGENRVQEARAKYAQMRAEQPEDEAEGTVKLHMIGPVQSNKAKKAVEFFDLIQSLDRLDLADAFNRHAQALGKKVACLVEVKISPEATKSGVEPDSLDEFLSEVRSRPSLEIKGLMGIAPYTTNPEEARPYFGRLRSIFEKTGLEILSMGMSGDFEVAIEEGSTMVRIGTALFGPRT